MENRFEHTPPEEKKGWGEYATPPPIPGQYTPPGQQQNSKLPNLPHELSMCTRVQDHLPLLLENADGELSADTVRALYGHLSVCQECSKAFDEHQRLVSLLDAMPTVEMPMDFTGIIQRRIQLQAISPQGEAVVAATTASKRAFGSPPVQDTNTIKQRALTSNLKTVATLKKTSTTSARQNLRVENGLMQRLSAGTILTAIMAYFVSTSWGHEMLGQNIAAVRTWLDQVGAVLGRIPVLGRLALLAFTALAQMGDMLGETYRTVGDIAVRGLAMDIGVCIAAYYFLVVRKQRDMYGMRRV